MDMDYLSGDGVYSKKCCRWFEEKLGFRKTFLTTSCTHALEMAAILIDIQPGDEVIMPSFTFVSTANAFVMRGAKAVFVDIRPDTMNIDEKKIEQAVTSKTKAIVPVHYAGVGCEMDSIMKIAEKHGLYVIEDAAQGVMSLYKDRQLGSIGHMAAFSFHETKNFTSGGEGGLFIGNDDRFLERAEIIREKGTNRSQFFRGQIDKYSWCDIGSSYLPSEIQAAYLYGLLEEAEEITDFRLNIWDRYYNALKPLADAGHIELPFVPDECKHNGHMFYIKVKDLSVRSEVISYLKDRHINAVFHYVPLHSARAGCEHGRFSGEDVFTTKESERLIRLPLWYAMPDSSPEFIAEKINSFFNK